ncbi:GrpB family protein, partial [Actinoplanes sp. NPDC051411]|uniref:GrpB family protein n=1 Tax=Actinoplanes sp. NPDC051411 TaxID=3155522 RepID=UPI00341E3FA1
GARALAVEHVGSTAVPGLAAKDRVDIDLIVADPADEDAYVPALSAAGLTLASREPHWYGHRCLWTETHDANVHVFGPDCDEHLRHLVFRDWLRAHPADRDRYAACKLAAAAAHPLSMARYVAAKAGTIVDILTRAGLRPPVQRLTFRATHLPAVRDGRKRVTMRFRDPVQIGPAVLVFGSGDEVHLPGRITSAVAKPVNRVTDDEAREDGFADAAGVLPGLRDYYPDLQPDDEIVIVHFDTA